MHHQRKPWHWFMAGGLAVAAVLAGVRVQAADATVNEAAVERTRKLVRMLDDIYKSAIVLITQHYVDEKSDLPAGEAFKALFATMREKGWHEVRLLDATGDPLVPDNAPQDAFEREAIRQLKAGKPYYEEVVQRDGKPYLRAATAIPVVMEKCTLCHDNFKGVEKGKAIGALGYTLKIE